MPKLELSKEEELRILEEGLKGQFWLVLSSWLSDSSMTAGGVALGEQTDRREWYAGKATGLKLALQRPSERSRELRRYLTEQAKKS